MTTPEPDRARLPRRQGRAATASRAAHYQRGIDLARRRWRAPRRPRRPALAGGQPGRRGATHGKLFALRVIPEIEARCCAWSTSTPSYDHAAAARALANLYWKAPALISVGSSKKAAVYFELALARAPTSPATRPTAPTFSPTARLRARGPLLAPRGATPALDARPGRREWRQLARDVAGLPLSDRR